MKPKKKHLYSFKFHENEVSEWRRKAKRLKTTLTGLIEKRMNQETDQTDPHEKHLGI